MHGLIHCQARGAWVGSVDAGVGMHFSFHELIAHITKTRAFTAGTILGGGTVSNEDERAGVACLAEKRSRESIALGAAVTPFLRDGDSIRIELLDASGHSSFGAIEQKVVRA